MTFTERLSGFFFFYKIYMLMLLRLAWIILLFQRFVLVQPISFQKKLDTEGKTNNSSPYDLIYFWESSENPKYNVLFMLK